MPSTTTRWPGVQTIFNDPKIAASVPHAHRLNVDFVVRVHDGNLVSALQFRDCALRHEQGYRA